MNTAKFGLGAAALLLVIGAILVVDQHRANASLRNEVGALRAALEHERSASLAPVTSSDRPRIAALAPGSSMVVQSTAAKKSSPVAGDTAGSTVPAGMRRSADWTDQGTATPAAALETYLWAGDRIDVEARARSLGFGALKPTVDEFYARLSPEIRARYDSPEKLWAVLLAGATQAARVTAFELVAQKPGSAADPNTLLLHVRTQKEGGVIEQGDMAFEHSADGWRRTLPTNLITPIFDLFPSAKDPAK